MRIFPFILVVLFFILAGPVSSPAQNAASVEPLLLYKAQQDKNCRHWVDSVMDKLSFKEKVGQLFIYTIAPVNTKRNLELLREAIDTYKVGGLLFSGDDHFRRGMGVGDAFARHTCVSTEYGVGMHS